MSFFKSIVMVILLALTPLTHADAMLQRLSGETIPFSSLAGKWVFINYWASWCEPCREEIAELNRFYQQNQDKNIAMFAVNYDMVSTRKQQKLVKQFNITFPALKGDPARSLNLGPIKGVPVTFVFNPKGHLSQILYGEQTAHSLCKASLNHRC